MSAWPWMRRWLRLPTCRPLPRRPHATDCAVAPRPRNAPETTMWLKQCVAALGLAMLVGCSLPPQQGRTESSALPAEQARQTALGRAIAPLADAHPGLSGIYALADARAAFAARALLLRAAEKTLDVQYYIWRGDMTGTLLLEALYDAAERG